MTSSDGNKVTVYEAGQRRRFGLIQTWARLGRNVFMSRDFIGQMFFRDFIGVYKKSFVGLSWLILAPLISIASWVFMNAAGILVAGDVKIPYPAYVLLSVSIWSLFIGFYSSAAATLTAGSSFILHVRYPHEVLLIKQTGEHLATFCVSFLLNLMVLFAFDISPSWKIVYFPLFVLPLFFLGAGIGLVVAVLGAVSPDLRRLTDNLLGLLIFATPVVYAPDFKHHALQKINHWNPLTYLINVPRQMILYGTFPDPWRYAIAASLAVLFFMLAWRFFFVCEQKVIEKMY